MKIKEAIAMQGTEFTYQFLDGDTIQAYVRKFDPKVGLSCWSFGLVTERGFIFEPKDREEEREQACCIIGFNIIDEPEKKRAMMRVLEEIKTTGKRVRKHKARGSFAGCPL